MPLTRRPLARILAYREDGQDWRYSIRADGEPAEGKVPAMTEQAGSAAPGAGRIPQGSGWAWFADEFPDGIDVMFVRGVEPERVIETLGADAAVASMLSAEAAVQTLSYSWVRAGRTGEWVFAVIGAPLGSDEYQRAGLRLSAGTEVALFAAGMELDHFYYFVDGTEVTSFEPLLSAWRDGTDPDRFVPQMRQVGLHVDPPNDDDPISHLNPTIALFEMLTLELGIRLSRETAMGPLLTARLGENDG
jgi:hypothetical protein